MKSNNLIKKISYSAIILSITLVLSFFELPLPFFPSFLKIDISDSVLTYCGLNFNPLLIILIAFLKSIIHFIMKGSSIGIPIDQLIMFISSVSFYLIFLNLFKLLKNIKLSSFLSILIYSIFMFVFNYYIATPIYFKLCNLPLPNPYLEFNLIYIPFNIIKSLINCSIIYCLFNNLNINKQ